MNLYLINHNLKYDIECLCAVFFQGEKITDDVNENILVKSILKEQEHTFIGKTEIIMDGKRYVSQCVSKEKGKKGIQTALMRSFYLVAKKATNITPPWGILTGIRPTKTVLNILDLENKEKSIKQIQKKYLIKDEKAELCYETAKSRGLANSLSDLKSASIYISIPFCPSRCNYCSFVSHSIEKAEKLIPEYLIKLCEEINCTADTVRDLGLNIETIYIGGGTPTILSANELEILLKSIYTSFDLKNLKEISIEAGRPDTITKEKLLALKCFGDIRISINPQTLNDEVLLEIGRKHTSKDFFDAFGLARELGFANINVDLIAGLPNDSLLSFKNSLDKIVALKPENITVHTLSIKRSADNTQSGKANYLAKSLETAEMINFSCKTLYDEGYHAYYMYKQRNTVGNLENIGFAKKGFDCLYNIFMMEEIHTVLGIGAGAVTKLVNPKNNQIERIFNPKYPYEYIDRFESLKNEKNKVVLFYEQSIL